MQKVSGGGPPDPPKANTSPLLLYSLNSLFVVGPSTEKSLKKGPGLIIQEYWQTAPSIKVEIRLIFNFNGCYIFIRMHTRYIVHQACTHVVHFRGACCTVKPSIPRTVDHGAQTAAPPLEFSQLPSFYTKIRP